MMYLLWASPALLVFVLIASGRVTTTIAAWAGLFLTALLGLVSAPVPFGWTELGDAILRGGWIGWIIAPYIFGGLLFWNIASAKDGRDDAQDLALDTPLAQRRLLFFACFLVGPFAEAATGFGVGMLSTILLIRRLPIPFAPHLMLFSLLSQTMVPWGSMASGTLLGASYARVSATSLGLYSIMPLFAMMCVWMPLFWRTAAKAGFATSWQECAKEACWIVVAFALLAAATALLGPEISLLAAYGPLIAVRYWIDQSPRQQQCYLVIRRVTPYVCLISCLVLTRLINPLAEFLSTLLPWQPFANLPAWMPFFHAGSWLMAAAVIVVLVRGKLSVLPVQIRSSWRSAQAAIMTVFLFSMMAEILSATGIAQAIAQGMYGILHHWMVFLIPVLAGGFGMLTNSASAANSLFMPSQLYFAEQAGLSVSLVIALQHVSSCAMSMFSPVRMTISASLNKTPGHERATYLLMVPFMMGGMAVLVLFAGIILLI